MLKELERSVTSETDFVPIGALRRSLDRLAQQFGFKIEEETDDLGPVRCAYLEMQDGHRFLLRRYASFPDQMVDLFVPSRLPDYEAALNQIADELGLRRDEIIAGEGEPRQGL
jgi:hypothetical protein